MNKATTVCYVHDGTIKSYGIHSCSQKYDCNLYVIGFYSKEKFVKGISASFLEQQTKSFSKLFDKLFFDKSLK